MGIIIQLAIVLVLIIIGFVIGKKFEKKHYDSIKNRNKKFEKIQINNLKTLTIDQEKIRGSKLVTGSVVISVDYFKRFLASFRLIFGGRLYSYETLLDRAKKEAILRMKEQAGEVDLIINVRVETSAISRGHQGGRGSSIGSVEVLAFGTAIKL